MSTSKSYKYIVQTKKAGHGTPIPTSTNHSNDKGSTMTSTSIYQSIKPTYLYIKQHSITKKKYFGKTTRDPYKYNGSGKVWTRHINKHGKEHIVTLWVSDLFYDTSIVDIALHFSIENNIVESNDWANLKLENGLDGGDTWSGKSHSKESNAKRSASMKGRISNKKGITGIYLHSEETKNKISAAKIGRTRSEEERISMRKPKSKCICPHCGQLGGSNNMKRWHFDNCKIFLKNEVAPVSATVSFYTNSSSSSTSKSTFSNSRSIASSDSISLEVNL